MRVILVHPSALMYSEIFLRLEPLGLERVAAAVRNAGHEVRVVDLQVLSRSLLDREMAEFAPEALGISLNYLANVPEAIEIAHQAKAMLPGCFVFFGGHSISFIAEHVLASGRRRGRRDREGRRRARRPASAGGGAGRRAEDGPRGHLRGGPGSGPQAPRHPGRAPAGA